MSDPAIKFRISIPTRLVLYFALLTAILAAVVGHCGGEGHATDIRPLPPYCQYFGFALPIVYGSLLTSPWLIVVAASRETRMTPIRRILVVVVVWALMVVHVYGLLPSIQ